MHTHYTHTLTLNTYTHTYIQIAVASAVHVALVVPDVPPVPDIFGASSVPILFLFLPDKCIYYHADFGHLLNTGGMVCLFQLLHPFISHPPLGSPSLTHNRL